MRVFISWSGERSKAVAELLDEWLQCVLQAIRPWMSSKDIDRGSLWFSEISDQLKDTTIGIICLTKSNLNKPWILFEAGALAKGLSNSRICTFLIDLETTDVSNPLAQFNHTMPDKEGLFELVRTLNSALGEKSLREKVVEQVFETYWEQFKDGFNQILENTDAEEGKLPARSEDSILAEVLHTVRSLDKRVRSIERSKLPESPITNQNLSEGAAIQQIAQMLLDGTPRDEVEKEIGRLFPVKVAKTAFKKVYSQDTNDTTNQVKHHAKIPGFEM